MSDAQGYRDWLMAKGMVEWVNEAEIRRAEREGREPQGLKPVPPPPKGSWDDLEARGKTWVQLKAKAERSMQRAQRTAKKPRRAA
jgi:hypothetical protein